MYGSKYSNYTENDMLYYIKSDINIDTKPEKYLEDIKQYVEITKTMNLTDRKIQNISIMKKDR